MNFRSRKGGPFYRRIRPLLLVLSAGLWLAGCAAAPTQEMSDARQSIEAAHVAAIMAGEESPGLLRAERLLRQAQQDLYAGDYRAARRSAIEARQAASKARQKIAAN